LEVYSRSPKRVTRAGSKLTPTRRLTGDLDLYLPANFVSRVGLCRFSIRTRAQVKVRRRPMTCIEDADLAR